jgi:hypothetical protein
MDGSTDKEGKEIVYIDYEGVTSTGMSHEPGQMRFIDLPEEIQALLVKADREQTEAANPRKRQRRLKILPVSSETLFSPHAFEKRRRRLQF